MKAAQRYAIVLVTAPDLTVAREIVRLALEERLVACGNILPGLESHYWWEGKIETSAEVLILFKTMVDRIKALETLILSNHPYQTPEIIVVPLSAGTKRYLTWIKDSLRES